MAPAGGVEIDKQTGGVVIPTPPQVAGQRPEPFLHGSDKAVERARLAHDGSNLLGGGGQHADFVVAEDTGRDGLNHEDSLKNPAINERNAEERLIGSSPASLKYLKRGWVRPVPQRRAHLFRDQSDQAFMDGHTQVADRLAPEPQSRGQH